MRLMKGADIYQIAKACRKSRVMIEKFHAAHIKNVLTAGAIDVRKPKAPRKKPFAAETLANALFPQPLPRCPLIASSTSRPLWWNW